MINENAVMVVEVSRSKRPPQLLIQRILSERFAGMRERNPRFSLRAYAKRLGLSPGATTEILRGKRRISAKIVLRIAEKLQLEERERQVLLQAVHGHGDLQ